MSFVVPTNFRQLPPVWEMAQPLQVDGTGTMAYDADPVSWARNHILSVILTNPGERVMRPSYGAGVYNFVWENLDPLIEQTVISTIKQAVTSWEPNVTLNTVRFVQQPDFSGVVELQISFSVGASPTSHTVVFSLGGTGVEVTS